MGLDMYLTRKKYVKNWEHTPKKQRHIIKVSKNGNNIDTSKIMTIEFEEMYWRKANAIHNWFVENVQENIDNCAEYYVSSKQLEALLDDINYSLKNKDHAEEVLPTREGFFFGGTDYDEYYWQELEKTSETLQKLLDDKSIESDDFYYSSSW